MHTPSADLIYKEEAALGLIHALEYLLSPSTKINLCCEIGPGSEPCIRWVFTRHYVLDLRDLLWLAVRAESNIECGTAIHMLLKAADLVCQTPQASAWLAQKRLIKCNLIQSPSAVSRESRWFETRERNRSPLCSHSYVETRASPHAHLATFSKLQATASHKLPRSLLYLASIQRAVNLLPFGFGVIARFIGCDPKFGGISAVTLHNVEPTVPWEGNSCLLSVRYYCRWSGISNSPLIYQVGSRHPNAQPSVYR